MADENKRMAARQRVLKAAKIVSMDNKTIIDCAVRNQSETGAQLVIEKAISVPKEFQFFLASEDTIRDAMIVWHRGDRIGVTFTSESRPAPPKIRLYKR